MAELPPLPPGFTLDQPQQDVPPLPPGFVLDSPAQAAAPDQPSMLGTALKNYYGAMWEPLLAIGSNVVATPIAGLAGATQGVKNLASPGMTAGNRVESIQQAMSYEPRTQAGQTATGMLAYPFQKLAQFGNYVGSGVGTSQEAQGNIVRRPDRANIPRRMEGSPLAGAIVNTAIQSVPAVLGRGRVGANAGARPSPTVPPAASGESVAAGETAAAAQRATRLAEVPQKAPTLEELGAQKSAAYKAAEDSGVVISREGFNRLKLQILTDLKKVGINEKLHPKAVAVAEEIAKTKGQPTLQQIDMLRQIANDAKGTIDRADAYRGAQIVDKIDNFLEDLKPTDVVAGDAAGIEALVRARELNTRFRKAESIAELMDRAKTKAGANYTQAGLEHAIRSEFKSLALNKNQLRRFAPEEQAAIKAIARGSPMENALRNLGKFDPTTGGMAAFISAMLAGGGAAATGGASLALPVVGFAAKRVATGMASRKVGRLDEMVRRGRGTPQNALATRAPNALSKEVQP